VTWCTHAIRVRNWRRCDRLPSICLQRRVARLPGQLRRSPASGMPQLQTDLRLAFGVDEIDDALPPRCVLVRVHARAARCDARLRRDAHHLREHETRTAEWACADVDHVEFAWCTVAGP